MLGMVSQERFDQLAQDDSFIADLHEVTSKFERYKKGETWYKGPKSPVTAYFSMEFGIDVSLPTYSGGLGILSGDHMKTASDLGLPFVAVACSTAWLFNQTINAQGEQIESYLPVNFDDLPISPVLDHAGQELRVWIPMPGRQVALKIWEARVGRVRLILLDTDLPQTPAGSRHHLQAL